MLSSKKAAPPFKTPTQDDLMKGMWTFDPAGADLSDLREMVTDGIPGAAEAVKEGEALQGMIDYLEASRKKELQGE